MNYWGIVKGKNKSFYTPQELNLPAIECSSSSIRKVDGWCAESDLTKSQYLVNAVGSKRASSMTFLTAAFAETLWPYSIRSWLPGWRVFNRSPWLHMGFSIPSTLCILATFVPGVREVFALLPLNWWQISLAVSFALTIILLDELIPKPLHRRKYGY